MPGSWRLTAGKGISHSFAHILDALDRSVNGLLGVSLGMLQLALSFPVLVAGDLTLELFRLTSEPIVPCTRWCSSVLRDNRTARTYVVSNVSVVMPSTGHRVSGHPHELEDNPNDEKNDPDCPEDGNTCHEADDHQHNTEKDHVHLLSGSIKCCRRLSSRSGLVSLCRWS